MRAIVTGAAGFIGSHLVEALVEAGHDVIAVDRRRFHFPGAAVHVRPVAIAPLPPADVIFHLAGQPGVRDSWDRFDRYLDDNLLTTKWVLEHARRTGARVVFASSSSVYGSGTGGEMLPISPYGVTKLAVEHLCRAYHEAFNVYAVGLRYFTVYGPRQRPDMAFHRFITAAMDGEHVEIYGDGEQTRCFTHVADAVAATILAADVEPGVYDVASGSRASVLDALDLIGQLLNRRVRVRHLPAADGDPRDIIPARLPLPGYKPRVKLRDGLASHIDYVLAGRAAQAA